MIIPISSGFEDRVPSIRIRDGLQVAFNKQFFLDKFINDNDAKVKKMVLEYDLAIKNITENEIFVLFKSKS
jgi:hypothetical protein